MQFDIDPWCHISQTQLFLRCSTMNDFDFTGISMLEGCKSDAMGSALVRESCSWICKHGRPIARCLWEFAHEGVIFGGRLQACWLSEACGKQNTVVTTVCEPKSQANVTTEILTLQVDLAAALAAHRMANDVLAKAQAEIDAFSQNFGDLTATELAAKREREKAKLEAAEQSLYSAQERLKGLQAELRETSKELEASTQNQAKHDEEKQKLQSMLSQATAQLNNSRSSLDELTSTQTGMIRQAKSLLEEVRLYSEQLDAEKSAHDDTKSKLKSQEAKTEEAHTWLTLTLVAFGIMMVVCCGCVMGLFARQRKWRNLALSRASNMGADVVLGRPVGSGGGSDEVGKNTFETRQALPVKPGERDIDTDQDELRRLRSTTSAQEPRNVIGEQLMTRSPTGTTVKEAWTS